MTLPALIPPVPSKAPVDIHPDCPVAHRLPDRVPELLGILGFKPDYTLAGGRLYSVDGYWIPVLVPEKYESWAGAVAYLLSAVQGMGKR